MEENIAVSVVVAVYNRELLLPRCLDSLVFQTLENIEIILVDDFSEDNSWEVMEEWQERFPEKICIMKSESKGVAYAKNTGAKVARGEYITFVDSDDYVDYKMLKNLYECAEKNDFPEMVYSPIFRFYGKSVQKFATLEHHETIEDYLKNNHHYLHGKLFRADIFQKYGYLPLYRQGEDISWLFPVVSNLTTIAYHNTPYYYYELSENSISSDFTSFQSVKDVMDGSEYMIKNVNPVYKELTILRAFYRIRDFATGRPMFKDILWKYFHDHLDVLDEVNDLEKKSKPLFDLSNEIREYYVEIPQNIYVNGFKVFDKQYSEEKYVKALRETPNIIILDEKNCDLSTCPECVSLAYKENNMDFVGKYFAVQACYQYGGIYIDDSVTIDYPFNRLLNDPCFFGYESETEFTDNVFGACAGNEIFKRILKTYEISCLYDDLFAPLQARIKTIVLGMTNISLISSEIKMLEYGVCLYPVDMFVYTLPYTKNLALCHYACFDECNISEGSIAAILQSLHQRETRTKVKAQNTPAIRRDRDYLKKKCATLEKDVKTIKTRNGFLSVYTENADKVLNYLKENADKDRVWLANKNDRLEAKVEKYTKDCIWLTQKAERLEAKVESYDKDRNWLSKKAERLEAQVESCNKDRAWLAQKAERLEAKVESCNKDRAWLAQKAERLEAKVEDYNKDRAWLTQKAERLEAKVENYNKDRAWLVQKAERLEAKVEDYNKDRAWLAQKAERLESKVELLDKELLEFRSSFIARVGRKLRKIIYKR